jgi:hypothetical protein
VYDGDMALIACNDDFYTSLPCGVYVSRLENIPFAAGTTYYIVVDGYGNDFGDYVLAVDQLNGHAFECPDYSIDEGEPPLADDYIDNYNGGCNTPGYPFQNIAGDANGEFIAVRRDRVVRERGQQLPRHGLVRPDRRRRGHHRGHRRRRFPDLRLRTRPPGLHDGRRHPADDRRAAAARRP